MIAISSWLGGNTLVVIVYHLHSPSLVQRHPGQWSRMWSSSPDVVI
ncbi:hypothetical protein M3J09_009858 [Ascochyta lentis]